jgi:CPA2 family monovalent cation:H+ antiporter-2
MPHDVPLIVTIAASLGLALALGIVAARLGLPALIGYLIAGVLIGPATPGFVADMHLSAQLAEIGVMLLMFGVGLHFSVRDLLEVRRIALPGAVVQMTVATVLGAGVAMTWGWTLGAGLVFGLALSVASTVVLIRALEQRGLISSINGKIAVGWLIVEDLAMVLVLVLLPAVAGLLGGTAGTGIGVREDWPLWLRLGVTALELGAFLALMMLVGRRVFPWLLWQVAGTGSRELFTLAVIATAVGVAYGAAALFGVSFALGAFFAGMVMRESPLSHRAAGESLPLRDAFAVLFFVAVGMLFDPRVLIDEPLRVLTVVAIIVVGKSLAALLIVLAFRYPLNTALTVSASLAQIGEFSFILVGLGATLGLLPPEAASLVLAGALISISLNPVVFRLIEPVQEWVRARSRLARRLERPNDPLGQLPASVASSHVTGHVVLVGYGRVGRTIAEALEARGLRYVVAEQNREQVGDMRRSGLHAVAGDASEPAVLIQAHVARAATLVIATPDAARARRMMETAQMLNPDIRILVRTHSDAEAGMLERLPGVTAFMGERELARSMIREVVGDPEAPGEAAAERAAS